MSQKDFRCWLAAYPWILVLDGLDEVPLSSNRSQVMQAIRDFVGVEAHHVDADLLVLATTRPQGYSDEFSPTLYRHLPLSPLEATNALQYGNRLAVARHPGQPTRVEELTGALRRATKNPATARLMQSPLQVTIMLALIEGGGEPPEQRWKLFHDYYHTIYRREKERQTSFSKLLGQYEPDIHWIHHRAGWILQKRNATEGNTDSRLTHAEFEHIVEQRLAHSGHEEGNKRAELVREIRRAATDRLVFLVGNTESQIGFEIRSLQEFMAAEHAFDGGETCVRKCIHAIAALPYWRNVFLFISGRIFFERQELVDNVIASCNLLNEVPGDVDRLVLLGSRLALSLLKDGAARTQPGSIRAIARCAARALDMDDPTLIPIFAEVCTGDVETVIRPELEKSLGKTGAQGGTGNRGLCAYLATMSKDWAISLMREHFPWAVRDAGPLFQRLDEERAVPVVLRRKLVENMLRPSLTYAAWWLTEYPDDGIHLKCIKAIREVFRQRRQSRVTVLLNEKERIRLDILSGPPLSAWAVVEYPEFPSGTVNIEWAIARQATVFAKAQNIDGLVRAIDGLATEFPTYSGGDQGASWMWPWQFRICLAMKESGVTWDAVIDHLKAGRIGDHEEWSQWVEAVDQGLSIEQLRSGPDWTVSRDSLAAVVGSSRWLLGVDQVGSDTLAKAMIPALERFPELCNESDLFEACSSEMLGGIRAGENGPRDTVRAFVDVCTSRDVPIPSVLIVAALLGGRGESDTFEVMCKIGRAKLRKSWMPSWEEFGKEITPIIATVVRLANATDEGAYALRAISLLPPIQGMQAISDGSLRRLHDLGGSYEMSARLLNAYAFEWGENDVSSIMQVVSEAERCQRSAISEMLEFIEREGIHGRNIEAFLMELRRISSGKDEFWPYMDPEALLVKVVERRPAGHTIPDPAVRQSEGGDLTAVM
jgi:hypothetical protein